MQQGFQDIKGELQSVQKEIRQDQRDIKEELQGVQNDIGEKLQQIQEELQAVREQLSQFLSFEISPSNPAHSCKEIYERNTSSHSGYYWLQSCLNSQTVQVYCNMERTCGGVQGGWMKVISINMSNSNSSCPYDFHMLNSPKRLCAMNINGPGCSSAYFDVHGVEYSQVCGNIIGYQQRSPDAFWPYYNNRTKTIDDNYVDGISLTHGQNSRKHIWTLAAALHEVTSTLHDRLCPCTNIHNYLIRPIPPYVGNDYFCDTASAQ